jgi:hypothetical protein
MAVVGHSQRRFVLLEEPEPLPRDSFHYVPALQNKSGELAALSEAPDDVWERMTPLLHLVGPKSQQEKISIDRVKAWIRKLARAVGERPIYLDVLRIRPNRSVALKDGGKWPLLKEAFAAARKRKMNAIPVIWAGESNATHIKLVGNTLGTDGLGVGIRFRIRSVTFPPGPSGEEYLGELLASLGATPDCADLLITSITSPPMTKSTPKT